MRVDAGRLVLDVDPVGRIIGVAPRSRPDRSFLAAVDVGSCRYEGAEATWTDRDVAVDADEISVQLASVDLMVTLRHGFGTGWTTRLLVVNTSPGPAVVERLQLIARSAAGHRLSALAAGSRLCWAVQSADGDGPLLAARLLAGAVAHVDGNGFELGVLRLGPAQRYVLQCRWDLFATPRSVVSGPGRDVLIARTAYEVGEAVLMPEDPDAALVAPRGVTVDTVEEAELAGREVSAVEPGRHRIELRSAEGDVCLDLSWVRPLSDQLVVWAATVLAGPRTAAGVIALRDLSTGVVLQAALGGGGLADSEQAADALDRLAAQLAADTDGWSDPLAVLFLLGEHSRTGDDDLLAAALAREALLLDDDGPPPPGLGLAVLRTALVAAGHGERVAALVLRAVQRAERVLVPGAGEAPSIEVTEVDRRASELELLLAVRPLLPDDHPTRQRLHALVRGLGAALGAGLPGRLIDPPPVAEHAHLVAVLRMLPEDGLGTVTRGWGTTASLLAHRLTSEVLDRLSDAEVGPAAAWLALAQRPA
jgi:hypothetical protein